MDCHKCIQSMMNMESVTYVYDMIQYIKLNNMCMLVNVSYDKTYLYFHHYPYTDAEFIFHFPYLLR